MMGFGGYLIISIALDNNFNLSPDKLLVALISGSTIMVSEAVYFLIFRQRIVFFFECMLFYDELIIGSDLDKAAIEYSKPVETTQIPFPPDKPMHAERLPSSIFHLIRGRADTSHIIHALPSQQLALENIHKKIVSFSQLKNNDDKKLSINTDSPKATKATTVDCSICFENKANTFFLPCGHSGSCYPCSISLIKSTTVCHLCRAVYY
jgi:hypothetical protein